MTSDSLIGTGDQPAQLAISARGSVVGTRQDMKEALWFAVEGKLKSLFTWDTLDNVNDIFSQLTEGRADRDAYRIEA